jgi:hypothetical protein
VFPKCRLIKFRPGESPIRKNTTFRTQEKFEIKNIRFTFTFYCRQVFVFTVYISHGQLNKGGIFLPNINMSRLVNSRTLIPTWFSPSYISDWWDRIKVPPTTDTFISSQNLQQPVKEDSVALKITVVIH